jgi:hypothetical protein
MMASFVVTTGVRIDLYPFQGTWQCAVLHCLRFCSFMTSTDATLIYTDTVLMLLLYVSISHHSQGALHQHLEHTVI